MIKNISFKALMISSTVSEDNVVVVGALDENGSLLQFQREITKNMESKIYYEHEEVTSSNYTIIEVCLFNAKKFTVKLVGKCSNTLIVTVNIEKPVIDYSKLCEKFRIIFQGHEDKLIIK